MILATSERLQSVVDKPHIAAMYGRYILDHAGQEFDGLWEIQVDDAVYIDGQQYICTFITTGWSDIGIRANSGDLPNADMYLCTCVPEGLPYEIYIIGIDKMEGQGMITFVTDPDTASVKVVDADNVQIAPIAGGSGKTFMLAGIGDSYGVNVEKEGCTGKHITIVNNKDQTVTVELVENPQG